MCDSEKVGLEIIPNSVENTYTDPLIPKESESDVPNNTGVIDRSMSPEPSPEPSPKPSCPERLQYFPMENVEITEDSISFTMGDQHNSQLLNDTRIVYYSMVTNTFYESPGIRKLILTRLITHSKEYHFHVLRDMLSANKEMLFVVVQKK
jgi:hypothetical protein